VGPFRLGSGTLWDYARFIPSPDAQYALGLDATEGGDVVTVLDSLSGQVKLFVSGGKFLGWHPNSRSILYYQMFVMEAGLWLYDVDNGRRTLVAQPPMLDVTGIAISPDGRRMIYGTNTFGAHQIWRANLDGSEPVLLLDSPAIVAVWGWSPAGKAILFTGEPTEVQKGARTPIPNLWLMDSDGRNKKSLRGNLLFGYGFQPVWSPTGDKVAYVGANTLDSCWNKGDTYRTVPSCRYRGVAVYVEDVNTGALSLVRENAIDPAWSPDGSLLAFTALDSHQQVDLWISKPDGSEAHRLTDTPEVELLTVWWDQLGR
jgi:Tol biopolymer transport system component